MYTIHTLFRNQHDSERSFEFMGSKGREMQFYNAKERKELTMSSLSHENVASGKGGPAPSRQLQPGTKKL